MGTLETRVQFEELLTRAFVTGGSIAWLATLVFSVAVRLWIRVDERGYHRTLIDRICGIAVVRD